MTIEATLERIATALETIAKNTTPYNHGQEAAAGMRGSPAALKTFTAKPATVEVKAEPAKVELTLVEDKPLAGQTVNVKVPVNAAGEQIAAATVVVEPTKPAAAPVTRQQFMAKFQELYSDSAPNRGRNACVAILGKVGVGKASEIKDEQLSQAQELVLAALAA